MSDLAARAGEIAALVITVAVVAFLLRRLWLVRMSSSFPCSLRSHGPGGRQRWSAGVARYRATHLDWYRVFSLSPRPTHRFRRSNLYIIHQRAPAGGEGIAVLPFSVVVDLGYRGEQFEVSMGRQSYTGFSAWIEAAPPVRYDS
ncbi:MAG: hypothetical protein CSA58_03115 [Micrococcales bacterium]|nr:MAG: hypothetical protein CSB46_00360 [Micrococcales bacterium]PIE27656.1 MAG: hypothetical protein CSA58_03115 [Micrococcales bacterium]